MLSGTQSLTCGQLCHAWSAACERSSVFLETAVSTRVKIRKLPVLRCWLDHCTVERTLLIIYVARPYGRGATASQETVLHAMPTYHPLCGNYFEDLYSSFSLGSNGFYDLKAQMLIHLPRSRSLCPSPILHASPWKALSNESYPAKKTLWPRHPAEDGLLGSAS